MRFTKLIIYNVSVLLVLFFIVEAGFRIGASDYAFYQRTCAADFTEGAVLEMDTNWVQQDSILGWVCRKKPHLKFYRPSFWKVNYHINEFGFRSPEFPGARDRGKQQKRVLLLGDSFLFGIFLEEEKTITNRMQAYLGEDYEVYNMAIPGWGIDQMYQAYAKYAQLIQPDIVLLFFIDDDVSRVMEAFYWGATTKRAYRLDRDSLTFRSAYDGKLSKMEEYFCFNSQVVNRIYRIGVMQKAQPLTEVILDNWIRQVREQGSTFMAVRFPRREQINHPGLKKYDLKVFFERQQTFYHDLASEIRLVSKQKINSFYLEGDDHPSEAGADFITSKLVQIILDSR